MERSGGVSSSGSSLAGGNSGIWKFTPCRASSSTHTFGSKKQRKLIAIVKLSTFASTFSDSSTKLTLRKANRGNNEP